jgi:acyl-CoA synthetase (AMP-forming)/AMP-acid ligase II
MRLTDFLDRAAAFNPERTAFVDGAFRPSYQEVKAFTQRIAAGLVEAGLREGDRVAVLSENDARAFILMMGVHRAGGIYVPLNARNTLAANADLLDSTAAAFLALHETFAGLGKDLRGGAPSVRLTIGFGKGTGDLDYETLAACDGPVPDLSDDPHRVMTILPTGGTTGRSKGAMWSNGTWETLIATFWAHAPCDVPPVHLCAAPMTHAAGVLATMLLPRAPTNVVLRKADPLSILETIAREKVTHLYLPPTLLYGLLAHPDLRKFDVSSVRCFLVSAAPVAPEKLREAVSVFGPVICQSYGQAEAPFFLTYFSPQDIASAGPERLASCGRPTMFTRVEIMNDDGELLPAKATGEIVCSGNLRMEGYFNNPQATAEVSQFGWHHTGDIGFKDEEGFVYIVDRKKDMIITGGFNVFSAEVERVLLSHPAIQDCAVIGVPDEKWGEAIKAIVELKPDRELTEEELTVFARPLLGGVRMPKSIEFWPSLPRSPVGKILKRDIRDRFWAGRARVV